SLAGISEQDLAYGLRYIFGEVFTRSSPCCRLSDGDLNGSEYRFDVAPGEIIAAAFDRFGTFGHVAKRNVRYAEDRALLLYRSAVGQNSKRILFQFHKIEE